MNSTAALVESLTAKVSAWELDKGMPFIYNKVYSLACFMFYCSPIYVRILDSSSAFEFQVPLLRTLEEFTVFRQEKEEEKRRSRVCYPVILFLSCSRLKNVKRYWHIDKKSFFKKEKKLITQSIANSSMNYAYYRNKGSYKNS